MNRYAKLRNVGIALAWLIGVSPVWAALGEVAATIETDRQTLNGQLRSVAADGYSVVQLASPEGIEVSEYLTPAGRVFGVSWRGPVLPDLRKILGTHFATVEEALKARGRRRGPVAIHTNDLVLEMGGHPRAFHGRAFLPSLLPDSLSSAVVR